MSVSKISNLLLSSIAFVFILIVAKEILIPIILAFVIWFIMKEVNRLLKKIKIGKRSLPNVLTHALSFVFITYLLSIFVTLLIESTQNFIIILPEYQANLQDMIKYLSDYLGEDIGSLLQDWIESIDIEKLFSIVLSGLYSILSNGALIMLYTIFIMLDSSVFRTKLRAAYPENDRFLKISTVIDRINDSLSEYIVLKTLVSLMTAVLSYIIFLILGLDFAIFLSLIIFIFNFIPSIGSIIATIFPVIIAVLQFGDWLTVLLVLLLIGGIQVTVGNVVEPKIFGDRLNVSALTVIIALSVWGAIWGVAGMLLSVPLTIIMIIIFNQFPETRRISILLQTYSNRPDGDK